MGCLLLIQGDIEKFDNIVNFWYTKFWCTLCSKVSIERNRKGGNKFHIFSRLKDLYKWETWFLVWKKPRSSKLITILFSHIEKNPNWSLSVSLPVSKISRNSKLCGIKKNSWQGENEYEISNRDSTFLVWCHPEESKSKVKLEGLISLLVSKISRNPIFRVSNERFREWEIKCYISRQKCLLTALEQF